jgi:hypothetical protein
MVQLLSKRQIEFPTQMYRGDISQGITPFSSSSEQCGSYRDTLHVNS